MQGSQLPSTSRVPSRQAPAYTAPIPADDSDSEDFSPPSSPISLTSSLLALSPISNLSAELRQEQEAPPAPRSPSPPRPSVEIAPLPNSCPNCGASLIPLHPSTAALYYLTVTIPPASGIQVSVASRTTREAPKATSTPDSAPNKSSGRRQKRKAAAEDDIDEIGFSSLAPPAKTAKRQAAAASSTTRTSQASNSKKKVTFAPGTITSKTAISTSTVAENLLQFSEESEEDDLDDDEESLEQGLLPRVPHATFPASTTLQGASGPGTHRFPSPEEDSDEERWKTMTLAELEAEKQSLLVYKALWEREQAAMQAQNNDSQENEELIPRPPGEKGKNGWNLQEALRLKDDGYTYNEILATTRDAVAMAGLDCTISFRTQDPEKLLNCYARMRLKHSYLAQFKNDWACRELVMNALQNRRKSESARLRSLVGPKPANPIKTSKRKGFNPRPTAAQKQ